MKKFLAFTLFLTLTANYIYGQLGVSISSGINISKTEITNAGELRNTKPAPILNYFVGVSPNYQINESVLFIFDIQYSNKGYTVKNSLFLFNTKLIYLDFIPELEFKISGPFSLGIGIQYAFLLDQGFKGDNGGWKNPFGVRTVKLSDYGLSLKLKAELKQFFGFARYNYGLKDINNLTYNDINGSPIDGVKQFNRNLQVGIGYNFQIKHI